MNPSAAQGLLLASNNGTITATRLISETAEHWLLEIGKRKVRVDKTDPYQRVFPLMSQALTWSRADPMLIAHFVAREALAALTQVAPNIQGIEGGQ
jgi:hypothetical protein